MPSRQEVIALLVEALRNQRVHSTTREEDDE